MFWNISSRSQLLYILYNSLLSHSDIVKIVTMEEFSIQRMIVWFIRDQSTESLDEYAINEKHLTPQDSIVN